MIVIFLFIKRNDQLLAFYGHIKLRKRFWRRALNVFTQIIKISVMTGAKKLFCIRLVLDAIKKYKAVYFAGLGGAGALISKCIKKAEVIAYDDLGAEALRRIEVVDFPATVINDMHGGNLYEEGKAKYALSID